MQERFADVPGATVRRLPNPFKGVARHARFRRFTVDTEEKARLSQP